MINASTRLVGILGYPVEHSFSPLIHNASFKAQGINMRYVGLRVHPRHLPEAVAGMRALNFVGANVTIPHKEAVMPLVNELSGRAKAVGAVNTIVIRDGSLYGDNTDVAGFTVPLADRGKWITGKNVVILGAGGAARAAAYALLTDFCPDNVIIAARRMPPAEEIANELCPYGEIKTVALSEASIIMRESSLIVNATPVGMHPHTEATPWGDQTVFNPDQLVYDLVYRPRETLLLRKAAARGATVIDGLSMLIGQAAEAYLQWTGNMMPIDILEGVPEIEASTRNP